MGKEEKHAKEDKHPSKKGEGENIKVAVRVRPIFQKEVDRGERECVECDIASNQVIVRGEAGAPYMWTFDYLFNTSFSQNDIFLQVVHPMIESTLEGFNSTIFAYGQSGSGKTHTMTGVLGDKDLEGIIPRAFHYIFQRIREPAPGVQWRVYCSFVELYNGKCRDLLSENQVSLAIREGLDKNFFVQDLQNLECKFEKELFIRMEEGSERRHEGETDLNAHSSRSHSLFTVQLERTETTEEGDCKVVTSKLNLVDLAGSERLSKTNATGDRQKEGANINLSLSALGTVIDSLVKGKSHIPFRSSPLTMLLKDSLGGGSKTAMFANVRPSDADISETVSTLRFADRAKQIKNKPKIQMDPKDARIAELMEEIEDLRHRLRKYEGNPTTLPEEHPEELPEQENTEVALEQANSLVERLQLELGEAQAAARKAREELEGRATALSERAQQLSQEKDLLLQQLQDEKGQHHELQSMVLHFLGDLRARDDTLLAKEEGLDAKGYSVDAVASCLERVLGRVQQGLGGLDPAAVDQRVQSELGDQRRRFEELERERTRHQQEEVARISSLNEQAQGALNQAMTRLVKMKEKLEKEKAKGQDLQSQAKKQAEDTEARHAAEVTKMRAVIGDLEDQLQKQKALVVAGAGVRDVRASWDRSPSLSMRRPSAPESVPMSVSWTAEDAQRAQEEEEDLVRKGHALRQTYEAQKAALQQQLKRLEDASADPTEGSAPDAPAAKDKEREVRRLQAEMSRLRQGFSKEKQELVERIKALKAAAHESPPDEVERMEHELKGAQAELERRGAQFTAHREAAAQRVERLEAERRSLLESPGGADPEEAQRALAAANEALERERAELERMDAEFARKKLAVTGRIGSLEANIQQHAPRKRGSPGEALSPRKGAAESEIVGPDDAEERTPVPRGPRVVRAKSIGSKSGGGSPLHAALDGPDYDVQRLADEAIAYRDATEKANADANEAVLEAQRVTSELEHAHRERLFLQQQRDELAARAEQLKRDLERDQTTWVTERRELEQELENVRAEFLAEVQKCAKLNQDQIGICHQMEEAREAGQRKAAETDALREELAALRKQFGEQADQQRSFQELEAQLRSKHERDLQRMQAKLAEKATTLENNRKVLQAQQELLERRKAKELELADQVAAAHQRLKEQDAFMHQQLKEQADKMTSHTNRRLEEQMQKHQSALKEEKREREKLSKKLAKEKVKSEKVRERYDLQLVLCRELEQQVENLKEAELERLTHKDSVSLQRAEIESLIRNKELTERQKLLTSPQDRGPKGRSDNDDDDEALAVRLAARVRGNSGGGVGDRQRELLNHRTATARTPDPEPFQEDLSARMGRMPMGTGVGDRQRELLLRNRTVPTDLDEPVVAEERPPRRIGGVGVGGGERQRLLLQRVAEPAPPHVPLDPDPEDRVPKKGKKSKRQKELMAQMGGDDNDF